VHHRNRDDLAAEKRRRLLQEMRLQDGHAATHKSAGPEDIVERPAQDAEGLLGAVDRDGAVLKAAVRPDVGQTVDVVRVAVRVEHGIDTADMVFESLPVQVLRGVDEDAGAVPLEERRRARAPQFGPGESALADPVRAAGVAVQHAVNRRDAVRSTSTQQRHAERIRHRSP